jgi:hypothetical protein
VSTPPPRFLSLGIPPANMPASCGASGNPLLSELTPLSLLRRARFDLFEIGAADAPLGGLSRPGTAGALATGGLGPLPLSIIGAERSFVTAFFNLVPFVMSPRSAF